MVSGGRHRRYGPGTGGVAVDIDNLITRVGHIRKRIDDFTNTENMNPATGANIGAPEPDNPFKVGKKTKKGGEVPNLAFRIDKNTTSVKVQLIAENEIGTDLAEARKAVKQYEFEVNEDEAAAGFVKREFGVPLNFLTTYFCTRVIATLVKDGSIVQARNPALNPYQTIAGFKPIPIKNPDGSSTGLFAKFTTCDSTGTNCPDQTQPTGTLAAGQTNVKFVSPTDFKSTDTGVRVTMHITIPTTADTVKAIVIPLGASEVFDPSADNADALEDEFAITNKERAAGKINRKFGKKLEFGQRYKLIRLIARGDNVGGPGIDVIKIPTNALGDVPDIGNNNVAAEFTTPGQSGAVESNAVRPDNPFVDVTPNPNNNNLPDKGLKIKARGVKAILNIIIPNTAESVKCRIESQDDIAANKPFSLEDEWDDITDAERTAGKIVRQFGPTLDFSTLYKAVQFVATGANIGGDGVGKIKNPLKIPNPIVGVTGGQFTTPNRDGSFSTLGAGNLAFIAKTGARSKNNGVIVKLQYEVPVGTESLTVKIQDTRDSADKSKIISQTFNDINTVPGTPPRLGSIFEEEFPVKLDAGTAQNPITYGIVRLIAQGAGINNDLQDSANPDIVRAPRSQPPAGQYLATFTTAPALGFGNETVPSIPAAGDLFNSLENDAPRVTWTIFATESRNLNNRGGSSASGQVWFSDVGATDATVIAKRDTDSAQAEPLKFGGAISDLSQTNTVIELNGLVFGKQYQIIRNILEGPQGRAVQVAPSAIAFRAGGSINLTDLSFLPFPNDAKRFAITDLLKVSSNETLVRVQYQESASAVLARKIKVFKRVQGKFSDFRLQNEIVLRDDSNNFTAGLKTFDFSVMHPPSAIIDIQASMIALQGGVPATLDDFRLNVATDALPGLSDPGRPQYSGQRTDGAANSSPFAVPDVTLRFRPTGIKARFNPPDVNVISFDKTILFLIFATSYFTNIGGIGQVINNQFVYNPNTDAFIKIENFSFTLPPTDTTFGINIKQSAGDFFPVNRPDLTANPGGDNNLPTAIVADLQAAAAAGGTAQLTCRFVAFNRFVPTLPGDTNYVTVDSQPLLFSGLPSSPTVPNLFKGRSGTGNVF